MVGLTRPTPFNFGKQKRGNADTAASIDARDGGGEPLQNSERLRKPFFLVLLYSEIKSISAPNIVVQDPVHSSLKGKRLGVIKSPAENVKLVNDVIELPAPSPIFFGLCWSV